VIRHDAHANIVIVICTVGATGELGSAIEHRANLIDFVDVLDALLQKRHPLEAHTRVDVLLGRVSRIGKS
jgi:hypothetical protein